MSYIDTPDKRKRIQKALSEHLDPTGRPYYSGDIDGIFGEQSVLAITNFRHDRNIVYPPHPAAADTDLMRELGLLTIQDPVVVGAAAMKGIDLLSILKIFSLLQSLSKGNIMDSTKPWYASQTIWASALAILGTVLSFFHVNFGATDQAAVVEAVLQIVTAASALWAIIGRLRASKAIS